MHVIMVEPPGIENGQLLQPGDITGAQVEQREPHGPEVPVTTLTESACTETVNAVDLALADALTRASIAGEWSVVSQLAGELEARRVVASRRE